MPANHTPTSTLADGETKKALRGDRMVGGFNS
jgi:hypothetical protein